MNLSNRVAIVSMAQFNYSEKRAYSPEELAYQAIRPVLQETGLRFTPAYEKGGIDASLICHEHSRIARPFSASLVVDVAGANLRPDEKVDQDGAVGVLEAMWQIASGEFDTVLVVAVGQDSTAAGAGNAIENKVFDPFFMRPLGLDNVQAAALQANRYAHRYGLTPEHFAAISVKNLGNAIHHPLALRSGHYSTADVLASKRLADPITALQTRAFGDSAIVMLLASEQRAKQLTDKPVWIKGAANCCDGYFLGDRDLSECEVLRMASEKAYRMAGITDPRSEIDLIELTDEFSYQELMTYEGLGLCEAGDGIRWLDSGASRSNGRQPVNLSGGALAGCSHTTIGMGRIAEIFLQLRGEAGGRQVDKARTGLAQLASGPAGQFQQVMVLGTTP
ncbi:thiolase family protein [Burkholderia lata]|uniref:Thiolase n=1 Tax=Burkholderia lata (strain ATCC 17760 / DSM 23089 / LMG 22485 / NCIMB 9086 / R18194 / 383) TaxID=482957 RepID=A0A6P2I772_BURL3|nr:thiolase family protein [Burkholderia lata]VWB25206.1 thiolase [Burkholderia lata]